MLLRHGIALSTSDIDALVLSSELTPAEIDPLRALTPEAPVVRCGVAAGEVRVKNPGLVDFTLFSLGVEYRY